MSGAAGPRAELAESWRRSFEELPLHRFLGLSIEEERAGYARISLRTGPNSLGGIGGSVHGGILAAMVDIVMLRALFKTFEPTDVPSGTADLNITYMRPALGERIFATATVLKKGRQIAVCEVEITDTAGRLCAKGRTLYAIRQAAPGTTSSP